MGWCKRTEREIIAYHAKYNEPGGPDGSFVMSAFIEGFRIGNKEAQREARAILAAAKSEDK